MTDTTDKDDRLPFVPFEQERGNVIRGDFPCNPTRAFQVLTASDPFNHAVRYLEADWVDLRRRCKVPEPTAREVQAYRELCEQFSAAYGTGMAAAAVALSEAGVDVLYDPPPTNPEPQPAA